MDQQEAHIRQEIAYTRAAMGAKVAMIRERVEETVEETGSAVAKTVNTVLEHVKQVQDMIQNVTSTVDTTVAQVQDATHKTVAGGKPGIELIADMYQRPWIMLGAAVIAGYILGSSRRPHSATSPATVGSAAGADPDGFTTDNPTGNAFISPTSSSVGGTSTPSPAHMTNPASPP